MREITDSKEIQAIELKIFDKIHEFCHARGLNYSLYGGTLIGAIRHKGFIPWDDDIDLIMPRPDYEIFCKEFHAQDFSLHDYRNDADYILPYAKVYYDKTLLIENSLPNKKSSVFVDVFPADGFPDDTKSLRKAVKARFWNMLFVSAKNTPLRKSGRRFYKTLVVYVLRTLTWMIPTRFFLKRFQMHVQQYGYHDNPFVADMTWGYGASQCVPASAFDSFVDVEFEGRKAKVLSGWHIYLQNVFGDYMQLPPPEKRVTHHAFKAYWKE